MTITNQDRSTLQIGNGATTVWPYDFRIPNAEAVHVLIITNADGARQELTEEQYEVTGINNTDGGTITYPTVASGDPALTSDYSIYIDRETPITQEISVGNQTEYDAGVVEDVWDLLTMMLQDVQGADALHLRYPEGDTASGLLPSQQERADEYLFFDSEGNATTQPLIIVESVTSVNGQGGDVSLGLEDLNNVSGAAPSLNQALVWDGAQWLPVSQVASINGLYGTVILPLNAISNVLAGSPTVGQALVWNGANWVPATVIGAVTSVNGATGVVALGSDDLTDVDLAGIAADDALIWDGAQWLPQAVVFDVNGATGSIVLNLDDLADVNVPAPAVGQNLQWDGAAWSPSAPSVIGVTSINGVNGIVILNLGDVNDVSSAVPADGEVLTWSAVGSEWVPGTVGGAPVASVNGATGAVVLGVGDLDSVDLTGLGVGDFIVWDGANWIPSLEGGTSVISVNGKIGVVVLDADDIAEGAVNFYYTEAKVSANAEVTANSAKVSASGSVDTHSDVDVSTTPPNINDHLSWDGANWVPVAEPATGVISVNGANGAVVLDTADIVENTNLYYTEARVNANANVAANTAKVSAAGSIDTHSDVDTSTVPPTDGQVITWNAANAEWEPQAPAGGATSGSWKLLETQDVSGLAQITVDLPLTGYRAFRIKGIDLRQTNSTTVRLFLVGVTDPSLSVSYTLWANDSFSEDAAASFVQVGDYRSVRPSFYDMEITPGEVATTYPMVSGWSSGVNVPLAIDRGSSNVWKAGGKTTDRLEQITLNIQSGTWNNGLIELYGQIE